METVDEVIKLDFRRCDQFNGDFRQSDQIRRGARQYTKVLHELDFWLRVRRHYVFTTVVCLSNDLKSCNLCCQTSDN
jgi:hypothetical protein